MNKSRFLALSFVLTLSGFGAAYAQAPALAAGTYKIAVGAKAPCDVTVTADGAFTPADGCLTDVSLAKWKPTSSGYELLTSGGTVFAIVKPSGENLQGDSFAGDHKVVVSH